MDAIRRTRIGTQSAKHALGIIDRIARHQPAGGYAGFLVDLARSGFLDVNAINRARFGALITRDTLFDFEGVKSPVSGLKRGRLVWILQRYRLGEAILQRNTHPHKDRIQRSPYIVKVFTYRATLHFLFDPTPCQLRNGRPVSRRPPLLISIWPNKPRF